MTLTRRLILATLAAAATVAPAATAWADTFPSKPLTLVVPFPPGGSTDVVGRLLAKSLGEKLGQSVVVENRAGAGTVIGAGYVAKAPADGYTLFVSSGTTFTINPAINPKLPYDPIKSFDAIGLVGRTGLIVLANKDVPVTSVKDFVAYAKAAPGKYAYASFGNGSSSHFTGELLLRAAGVQLNHIPYKGSAPAMTDLIGGTVPFAVDTVVAAMPQLKAGKVKAIAVTTKKRSPFLPQVPTFAEAGIDLDADTWLAMVAPRGLPADVKARLEKALADVVATPAVREQLQAAGFEPTYGKGKVVEDMINAELPKMRATAQRAGIKPE